MVDHTHSPAVLTIRPVDEQSRPMHFSFPQKSVVALSEDSARFLWYQLMFDALQKIPQNTHAKQDMIDDCRIRYKSDANALKKIEEFKAIYEAEKAIDWYTKDSFVYRLVNQALRTENIDEILKFRFFIVDLCSQLQVEKTKMGLTEESTQIQVYRGAVIFKTDFIKIQESTGQLISMNGFVSTSREISVAEVFVSDFVESDQQVPCLFAITADARLRNVIFADIGLRSDIDELEVLFSLGSVFRIHSVTRDVMKNCWLVKMTATDDGWTNVQEYINVQKVELEEKSSIVLFGVLLWRDMNQLDKAERYFNNLLKTLPDNHEDIDSVYNNLGNIYREKGNLKDSLENYKCAYEIRLERLPINHIRTAGSINNIGTVYADKGDYEQALQFYHQAEEMEQILHPGDHQQKSITLMNIGLVHKKKKSYVIAMDYFMKSYEMRKRLLPREHPLIADSLWKIGGVYEDLEDYDHALEYYRQSHDMEKKVYSNDNPKLALGLKTIAIAERKKNDYEPHKPHLTRNQPDSTETCSQQKDEAPTSRSQEDEIDAICNQQDSTKTRNQQKDKAATTGDQEDKAASIDDQKDAVPSTRDQQDVDPQARIQQSTESIQETRDTHRANDTRDLWNCWDRLVGLLRRLPLNSDSYTSPLNDPATLPPDTFGVANTREDNDLMDAFESAGLRNTITPDPTDLPSPAENKRSWWRENCPIQ
jgi:tetratricopeptide (TPR) repeat protein